MSRGPSEAAGLQTNHTTLQYITPSITIPFDKEYHGGRMTLMLELALSIADEKATADDTADEGDAPAFSIFEVWIRT